MRGEGWTSSRRCTLTIDKGVKPCISPGLATVIASERAVSRQPYETLGMVARTHTKFPIKKLSLGRRRLGQPRVAEA